MKNMSQVHLSKFAEDPGREPVGIYACLLAGKQRIPQMGSITKAMSFERTFLQSINYGLTLTFTLDSFLVHSIKPRIKALDPDI